MVQFQEKKSASSIPSSSQPKVEWELLPKDFILPDDPAETILHPLLAAALTEALNLAGLMTATMIIATNMAITAKIDHKTVVKAPDWFFVPKVLPIEKGIIRRSYTPHKEGEVPAIVMEFLCDSEEDEYSYRPHPPYGKMWFYERIVKVPIYIIFDLASGLLEVWQLNSQGIYKLQTLDENGRYWLECLNLYLGVWQSELKNFLRRNKGYIPFTPKEKISLIDSVELTSNSIDLPIAFSFTNNLYYLRNHRRIDT